MLNINNPAQAKKSARALEKALERKGITLQRGQALDVLASMCGRGDWNALSQAFSPAGINAQLQDFERQHIAQNDDVTYGPEAMLLMPTGFQLRYADGTGPCDYVRVCDPLGREVAYWNSDEWAQAPQEVMGALLGALARGKAVAAPQGASAENVPTSVSSSTARLPTIQDVAFTDVSAVCIGGASGYRMNYVEDQVVGLLGEVGSDEFEENKDDYAIFMEREEDGQVITHQLSLELLASLKWDAAKKMFVAPEGTTYEFYFPVTMQAWFDMFCHPEKPSALTFGELESGTTFTTEDVPGVLRKTCGNVAATAAGANITFDAHEPVTLVYVPAQEEAPKPGQPKLYAVTFGYDVASSMQQHGRIAGYDIVDARTRLMALYDSLPAHLTKVHLEECSAQEVTGFQVFVDGGFYDEVKSLEQALNLAEVLEPTGSDEVTIEDQDGNCLWVIPCQSKDDEPGANA